MDNIGHMESGTTQRIQTLLSENSKVGIAVGKNPTLDQMGAALALYLAFRQMGKQVSIACPTEPLVEISSLVGIDKVKQALTGEEGDLVVSFPYKEGEIEKVSYTLEEGLLNIVVKASDEGLSFKEEDVNFKRSGGMPSLLFVVGTPRLSDLGNVFNPDSLKNTTVVNVDNSAENQGFGDVVLTSTKYSSVSEAVAQLLKTINAVIDTDIAQNLLSGIAFATQNFQDQKTSYLAFEMASVLMQKGAQRPKSLEQPKKDVEEDKSFMPFPRQQPQQQQQPREQRFVPKSDFGPRKQQQKPWEEPKQQQPSYTRAPQMQIPKPQMVQPQPVQSVQEDKTEEVAPPDWLAPKVYKSSTLV